ncbi:MAG TPA: hypothetical protein VF670_18090, partial [Duganella sp.]
AGDLPAGDIYGWQRQIMTKYFIYAVIVTLFTSCTSWTRLGGGGTSGSRGSTWSSHTGGGGGSFGGGSGGGGHK